MDPALAELGSRAAELGHLLTDLAADVASYAAGLDVEDGRLDAVNERRALLSELTRIYGADIDEVIAWGRSRGQAGWPARRRRSRGPTRCSRRGPRGRQGRGRSTSHEAATAGGGRTLGRDHR